MSRNVPLIILDPLYSTHDQDENDTRAMAALALQRPPRPSVVRSGHPRLSWGNCSLSCHSPHPPLPNFTKSLFMLKAAYTFSNKRTRICAGRRVRSLQMSAMRQSRGFMVKAAYTFSKAIDQTDEDGWASVTWNHPSVVGREGCEQTGFTVHIAADNNAKTIPVQWAFGAGDQAVTFPGSHPFPPNHSVDRAIIWPRGHMQRRNVCAFWGLAIAALLFPAGAQAKEETITLEVTGMS